MFGPFSRYGLYTIYWDTQSFLKSINFDVTFLVKKSFIQLLTDRRGPDQTAPYEQPGLGPYCLLDHISRNNLG